MWSWAGKDSLRYGFGDPVAKAQHDPSSGSEGLMEEGATIAHLAAGKARISCGGSPSHNPGSVGPP